MDGPACDRQLYEHSNDTPELLRTKSHTGHKRFAYSQTFSNNTRTRLNRGYCSFHLIFILCIIIQQVSALAIHGRSDWLESGTRSRTTTIWADIAASVSRPNVASESINAGAELKRRQTSTPTTPFPKPFDGGLGNNFTSSNCPLFFNNFLNDPNFQACHAVSLLLVTSQSFFQVTKRAEAVNQLLDTSCSADVVQCKGVMAGFVNTLKSQGGCGSDFQAQNPHVMQAYQGFLAYESVYNATCRKSTEKDRYCFTNAVTNSSSPTSSYVYYLPLGISLPSGTMPACNNCLENTVNDYSTAAGNGTLPLSSVYASAVEQIDNACGSRFITAAVPKVTNVAGRLHSSSGLILPLLVALFMTLW